MNEKIYEQQRDTIFVRHDLMNAIDHEDIGITFESDRFNEMDFINADGKKVILKFISSLDPEQRIGYANAAIYEY